MSGKTPGQTDDDGPYAGLSPYGIAVTALERILELDSGWMSWDEARAIASEAHGLAVAASGALQAEPTHRGGKRTAQTEDRSEEMSEEKKPGRAHPLDLPAMAAFAANYRLSGDQAARRWSTAVSDVREHFRMVADAAITASGLGDALTEQAALAEPRPAPGRQARQLDAALRGLAQIRKHVYDGDREWPDVELVVDDVIAEINELADLAVVPAQPAPELAAAMAALEDIARAAQGSIDASLPTDYDWFVSRAMEGLGCLPEGWPKAERPAPEHAAVMAETRRVLELFDQATTAVLTKRWALTDSEKRIISGFRQQAGLPK